MLMMEEKEHILKQNNNFKILLKINNTSPCTKILDQHFTKFKFMINHTSRTLIY